MIDKPLETGKYNISKTISNNNRYIENMSYNNKEKDLYNNQINVSNSPLGDNNNKIQDKNNNFKKEQ